MNTGPNQQPQPPTTAARRPSPQDDDDDDVEFGDYEAEARLLALHRAQQRSLLLSDGGGNDGAALASFDDGGAAYDDGYDEECEEEDEEVYPVSRPPPSGGLRRRQSDSDPASKSAAATSATGGTNAVNGRTSSGSKTRAPLPTATGTSNATTGSKARTGSAKPLRGGAVAPVAVASTSKPSGTLPSPRKRGSSDAAAIAGSGSSSAAPPKLRRKRKERKKVLNCTLSRYALVRELASEFNFVIEDDDDVEKFGFNMIWADTVLPLQKLARLANWQRFNHFPSMHLLCRKGHLGLTLGRMRRAFPDDYAFFPRTWALRSERSQFAKHVSQQTGARKTYIMKPNAGCQGRGIILTRDPLNAIEDGENYVVQEYMSKPLLIEGKKFDLRVYVLVTSVRHLSIMVYHEGLVRICADTYQKPTDSNLSNTCIHLTNYAVNKHSENFVFNQDAAESSVGNKRDFRFLNEWLTAQGHDVAAFWGGIDDAIVKAVIAALPRLQHVYSSVFPHSNDGYTCFEVLGFDVLVDEKLRPWLLEVNHTPSFHTDTPLDHRIKHGLLKEVWSIIRVGPNDKARHVTRERALRARRLGAAMSGSFAAAMPSANDDGGGGAAGSSSMPATPPEEAAADPMMADVIDPQAVIAVEDARRVNFRRAYPHPTNALRQAKYELLIRGARDASDDNKTTASQEARILEVRAERDKREARLEAERLLMPQQAGGGGGGGGGSSTSAAAAMATSGSFVRGGGGDKAAQQLPPATASSSNNNNGGGGSMHTDGSTTFASSAKAWMSQLRSGGPPGPQLPPAASPSSSTQDSSQLQQQPTRGRPSSPHMAGTSPHSGPQQHAMSAPPIRIPRDAPASASSPTTPPATTTTTGGPSCASARISGGNSNASSSSSRPRPPPPDPKVLRDRLHEQMEKHRRRMVLGPRLSVFQLRDTQLDSVLNGVAAANGGGGGGDYAHQQHQQQPQPQPQSDGGGSSSFKLASVASARPSASPLVRDKSVPPLPSPPPPLQQRNDGGYTGGHHPPHPQQSPQQGAAGGGSARAHHLGPQVLTVVAAPPPPPPPHPAQGSGRGSAADASHNMVAVSAATLQSHWLYHYDS